MDAITPKPNETQADFAVRFHAQAAALIPETDRRDAEMIRVWREAHPADPLFAVAQARFGRDHELHRDVVQFAEHSTTETRQQGEEEIEEPITYDLAALRGMIDAMNHRIADTRDFSPLSDGHTLGPEAIEAGGKNPDTLGYVGPYRLGMIGNATPRWAIFGDEWHDKDDVPRLRKLRRRSPEVWRASRIEDRIFDPIAALGSTTPRLEMGTVLYRANYRGQLVSKYTAAAPAAGSVFVPGLAGEPKRHSAGESPVLDENSVVQQVVAAIQQTDLWKWMEGQRAAETAGAGDELPAPNGEDGPPAAAPAVATPPVAEKPKPELDDEDKEMFSRYMAGECSDDDVKQYAAGKRAKYAAAEGTVADGDPATPEPTGTVAEQYARQRRADAERYARLDREKRDLETRVRAIERDRERAERYAKLTEISNEYAIDLEKEVAEADPEKLDGPGFDRQVAYIHRYAAKIPLASRTPRLYPRQDQPVEKGRATQAQVEAAKKYAREQADAGREVTFEEAIEHVRAAG